MMGCAYSARPICFARIQLASNAGLIDLQRGQVFGPQLLVAPLPLRVVGQDVVREVDDVPPAVVLRGEEVRVLDDAAERHRRRRPRSASSTARATGRARGSGTGRGSTRSRSTAFRVSSGRSGASLRSSGIATVERTRSNDSVPPAKVTSKPPPPRFTIRTGRDVRTSPPRSFTRCEDRRDAAPEGTLQVAEALAEARLVPRACPKRDLSPQPHEAHVFRAAPVLLPEKRPPHGVERAAVAVPAHPAHRGLGLEPLPVGGRAAASASRARTPAVP